MSKQDNLIDILMRETFEVADTREEISNQQIELLTNSKIVDDFKEKYITFWMGRYVRDSQAFRICIDQKVLDFPRNWSLFEQLYDALMFGHNLAVDVSEENDPDSLFQLLAGVYDAKRFYFVVLNLELFIVADSFGDSGIELILEKNGVTMWM
ncbi:MAG: hypothetical protein KAG61_14240, partial [Bacteriovoracaceae bacterium]|nr:hypothetical protein [Bacteriovoracaceae bacterium]